MARTDPGDMSYSYRCSLVRVIDGDTIVLDIDLGFRLGATMPIRLLGLNTPEMNTVEGKAARQWVIDWFAAHADLVVDTEKNPEKYGRWLGTVRAGGLSLNAELLDAGIAKPYDGHGPRSLRA